MRLSRRVAVPVLIALTSILLGLILIPRSYPVAEWKPLPGSRYLSRPDGSRLCYQELRRDPMRGAYPLIFVQGGPGGCISERTIQMLQPFSVAGFGVYAYDQTGGGSSSRLGSARGYSVARHIDDLDALVAVTGAKRVVLIG